MELRATLLGNHARNVRNARARNARVRNACNARARNARARDAGSTSARQLAPEHSNNTPKVARNSPRSVFNTAHKRCNSNDRILSV